MAEEEVQTLCWRAAMRLSYSVALMLLMEHARGTGEEFEYGPLSLDALEEQGLRVTGTRLEGVQKVLADIPGLYLSRE